MRRGVFRWKLMRCGRIWRSGRLSLLRPATALFPLFQKRLHAALGATFHPPRPTNDGILDLIAAVVIPLPTLGGISELAPQASRSIVQPTADKLLRRGFDFFL